MAKVYDRYILHTDDPTVRKDSSNEYKAEGGEWTKHVQHPNGVKEHVHEHGSSLYETHAPSLKEARAKLEEAQGRTEARLSSHTTEHTVYRNPDFAFHKGNRGHIKPTIIKGGKSDD